MRLLPRASSAYRPAGTVAAPRFQNHRTVRSRIGGPALFGFVQKHTSVGRRGPRRPKRPKNLAKTARKTS